MNFHEFVAMGGYAFYVWSAYGIALLVLLANLFLPLQQNRKIFRELRRKARLAERHEQTEVNP